MCNFEFQFRLRQSCDSIKSDDNITSITWYLGLILKEKGVHIEIEKNISNSELSLHLLIVYGPNQPNDWYVL